MLQDASGRNTANPLTSKWVQVTDALNQTVMGTQASVYWGLKGFPSAQDACGVTDGVEVDLALNNFPAMMMKIGGYGPNMMGGATPTALGVQKAAAYMQPRPSINKYLLLATDGLPNCKAGSSRTNDEAGAIQAVKDAAAAGLPTFVVGIATDRGTAHDTLNAMADAGTKPRSDPMTKYYPVASKDELLAVLANITGQIGSCTFPLTKAPPSPNDVAVDVDGKRVARDIGHMNGWDYGAGMKSIQIYGMLCDQLKSGTAKKVNIILGCPGVVIP